jgi:hypothetical protein
MAFTETTSGALAATRQTWRAKSVRDLLAEIVTDNPQATDRALLEKFVDQLRGDDDYFLAAAEYAFDNALRALRREQNQPTAVQKAEQAAKRAKLTVSHAKLVSRIKSKVVLLNMAMPNGKKLRDCSGEECRHFGGWYQRIAAEIGPSKLVGDVLSEKQVRELYKAG